MTAFQTIIDEAPDVPTGVLDPGPATWAGGTRCMGVPAKAKRKAIGGPFNVTPKRKPGQPLAPINRAARRNKRRGHRIDGTAATQSPIIRRANRRRWAKGIARASQRGNR